MVVDWIIYHYLTSSIFGSDFFILFNIFSFRELAYNYLFLQPFNSGKWQIIKMFYFAMKIQKENGHNWPYLIPASAFLLCFGSKFVVNEL